MTNFTEFQTEEQMNEAVNSIAHLQTLNVLVKDEFQSGTFESEEDYNNFIGNVKKHQHWKIPAMSQSLQLVKLLLFHCAPLLTVQMMK